MTHLLRATRREYQKMGKVIDHGELVKEAALMLQETVGARTTGDGHASRS
jgi:hypothetical protein